MKMNRSLVFVVACLLYCNAFASLSSERNKYKTMYAPRDNKDTVNFVARDSSSAYTQNGTCGEVKTSDFTVTGLKLSREYYWQRKLETGSIIDHYHCLFRIAEVTYEVKCKNGKIIWGNEAPGFESEDNGIIPTLKGTIAWKDDAPWETNTFKPRVTVKNTGSIALSNYHAQLWFRVPQGKNLSPLDIWYAPESSPSVKSVINAGGRVWMLDMHFDEHILYPSDSVSEGNIGLHLADWSNFDKTVCGIVLKDKDGNVLFGREPSVAECESYNGPSLIVPQYTIKTEGK